MDAEHINLQGAVYAAAGDYYRAASEWCESAITREALAASEGAFLSTAAAYGDALTRLLRHLATLEQTGSVVGQAKRTRRLNDLLAVEVRVMRHYFSLISTAPTHAG